MHENPYRGPESGERPVGPPSRTLRRRVLTLLLVAGIGVVVVAMLLPAVRTAREPAMRNSCQNKLKQLAVALQNYVDVTGQLPPAYTMDENGKPLHSWRTLILPFMEENELFKSIDLQKPWNDPVNAAAFRTVIDEYYCPSRPGPYDNTTTYLAIVTPESCLQPGKRRSLADLSDGVEQTVMLIEVDEAHAVPWMQPVDADEELLLSLGEDSELAHGSGFHASFADLRVHYLQVKIPADQRRAMVTIAGDDGKVLEFDESAR